MSALEIRKRIRHIMDYVNQSIISFKVPFFEVIDEQADDSKLFSFTDCCLKLERSVLKKREINLLASPYNFHKVLVLLDYIDRFLVSHETSSIIDELRQCTVNKRGVYYSLIGQGIKSTDELDIYITQVCELLEVSRLQLGIVASTKCLIAGGGLTSHATIEYL